MSRPLIAVSAAIEEIETAFGNKDCTKLTTAYTNAIYAAGGQPVIMPVVSEPPAGLLSRMDGLVLTGGGDIDPSLYGEAPDPTVYGIRKDRDLFESALYQEAIDLGLPILAICRGMQLINILRGGTLLQEIKSSTSHWQSAPADEPSHAVDVIPGTALFEAMKGSASAQVNSYHHQGLKDVGANLVVTAACGDVIEGVEATDADLVAVQWHPEQMAAVHPQQRALFEEFVDRALKAARVSDFQEIS
jgi:putative glutamine amidotransferase